MKPIGFVVKPVGFVVLAAMARVLWALPLAYSAYALSAIALAFIGEDVFRWARRRLRQRQRSAPVDWTQCAAWHSPGKDGSYWHCERETGHAGPHEAVTPVHRWEA